MDADQGKLFVGGTSSETNEEKLKEYFGKYGQVREVVVMRDKLTSRPRGFGFVSFADPSVVDAVLGDTHTIDGRAVEVKRALSREDQHTTPRSGNSTNGRTAVGAGGGNNIKTKKIFVGGLPPNLTEEEFRQYFQTFGTVEDLVVMYDGQTHRPRGFGFITFSSEDEVDKATQKNFHELNGKLVEVKRALPRESNPGNVGSRPIGGSGVHQAYGGSGGNTSSYEGRADNRHAQPAGGAYPAYGSAGYGAPSYGYGPGNNALGYVGFGSGGYGNAGAGFGVQAGMYGNPNAPASRYVSALPGGSVWNNQPAAAYGSAVPGGNPNFGTIAWSNPTSSAGAAVPPIGQASGGAAAYGGQSYGYGGQSYGTLSGRGVSGPGNPAGSAMGGAYGAAQGSGLPGGPAGYGGGYGGAYSRQGSQQ